MRLARAIGLGALPALSVLLGCALILGIEPPEHRDVGATCDTRDDCALDTPCATWACSDGRCAETRQPDGTLVLVGSVMGDCRKNVCQGGVPALQPDDTDVPLSTDECEKKACASGEVTIVSAPDGTPCGSLGALMCKGGACEGCKNNPGACPDRRRAKSSNAPTIHALRRSTPARC